jgi:hypothetical protein
MLGLRFLTVAFGALLKSNSRQLGGRHHQAAKLRGDPHLTTSTPPSLGLGRHQLRSSVASSGAWCAVRGGASRIILP